MKVYNLFLYVKGDAGEISIERVFHSARAVAIFFCNLKHTAKIPQIISSFDSEVNQILDCAVSTGMFAYQLFCYDYDKNSVVIDHAGIIDRAQFFLDEFGNEIPANPTKPTYSKWMK